MVGVLRSRDCDSLLGIGDIISFISWMALKRSKGPAAGEEVPGVILYLVGELGCIGADRGRGPHVGEEAPNAGLVALGVMKMSQFVKPFAMRRRLGVGVPLVIFAFGHGSRGVE